MRERPILFLAPMIRAIHMCQKTQTRRIIKGAHIITCDDRTGATDTACPYGVPGDVLWVRESYRFGAEWDDTKPSQVPPVAFSEDDPHTGIVYYEADGLMKRPEDNGWGKLRPGMFMPRWASRITLELVSVRAERLHEIGKDGRKAHDVLAEGVDPEAIMRNEAWFHKDDAPALAYAGLWESINGKGSWASNPWVWRLEFTKC